MITTVCQGPMYTFDLFAAVLVTSYKRKLMSSPESLRYSFTFWKYFNMRRLSVIDHELTLKILEFILNLIEKVKPVFLLSSMRIFCESNRTKP